jgi:AraC family transcriptional regulator of arabinose operon
MRITNIGYDYSHTADFNISRPFGSGNYLLLLLKTSAIFTLNASEIISESNSFILYSEGTPQFYRAHGPKFSNDWFHFELESGDKELLDELKIPLNQIIHIGDLSELSIIINNLCYETYASNQYKSEIIELYLKLFFTKLSNKIHNSKNEMINIHSDKLFLIRTQIYNQPHNNWSIDGLSQQLNMSRSCFQHLYKDLFGISPITDVILSRTERAKYFLSTTDISIKKIAEMCGYNNEIHFMRQFKQQTGLTPTEYRNINI